MVNTVLPMGHFLSHLHWVGPLILKLEHVKQSTRTLKSQGPQRILAQEFWNGAHELELRKAAGDADAAGQ